MQSPLNHALWSEIARHSPSPIGEHSVTLSAPSPYPALDVGPLDLHPGVALRAEVRLNGHLHHALLCYSVLGFQLSVKTVGHAGSFWGRWTPAERCSRAFAGLPNADQLSAKALEAYDAYWEAPSEASEFWVTWRKHQVLTPEAVAAYEAFNEAGAFDLLPTLYKELMGAGASH